MMDRQTDREGGRVSQSPGRGRGWGTAGAYE